MKALVKQHAKRGIWMQDVPEPTYGDNDVLIKIHKTAICGTDVHIYKWDTWAQKYIPTPLVVGHEFVGEIAALGRNITHLSIGQRVSGEGHLVCGHCRNCQTGTQHLCADTKGIGVNHPGAFAEYLTMPASNVIAVPDDISDDIASIFDPLGNAVHTALSFDLTGEDVLITGAGPIGLMAISIAKQVGARHVVITDVNAQRLEMARSLGATLAVDVSSTTLADACESAGLPTTFTVGMEMSGNGQAFNDLINAMAPGGKIAILGLVPEGHGVDWPHLIFKGLTLQGIYGRKMYDTWYKMLHLIQAGLDVSPVITNTFPVDAYEEAFEVACGGGAGKVILDWT